MEKLCFYQFFVVVRFPVYCQLFVARHYQWHFGLMMAHSFIIFQIWKILFHRQMKEIVCTEDEWKLEMTAVHRTCSNSISSSDMFRIAFTFRVQVDVPHLFFSLWNQPPRILNRNIPNFMKRTQHTHITLRFPHIYIYIYSYMKWVGIWMSKCLCECKTEPRHVARRIHSFLNSSESFHYAWNRNRNFRIFASLLLCVLRFAFLQLIHCLVP